jgi:alpha-D-ribose 1-methylphosphonate 5-triphosphate diphosphatase
MQQRFAIINAQLVTPTGAINDGVLRVEEGRIARIDSCVGNGCATVDASGAYLFPGFIDIHSDAIEKGIEPRPNTFFPVDIAVHELDKKLAACGITTIYHSLSFAELEVGLRNNNTAAKIIREVNAMQADLRIATKIHARFEITDLGAVPFLEGLIDDEQIHLFSVMDHSPGQGQFRDILAFKSYYGPVYAKSDAEMNKIIERKQSTRNSEGYAAMTHLLDICQKNHIAVASHDDDSADKVRRLSELGVAMTEFPVNREALQTAREMKVAICLGSPNVVRGQSQAKNLSAREAIAEGFGDILCSDYSPMTLLHAVLTLTRLELLPLHEAVAMVSLNPARAVGIAEDKGSLQVGKVADMVLVDASGEVAKVRKTYVAGREVFATC